MSVAIRAITRLQDADDLNVSLGVGVDEYALVYDHDTAKFVLRQVAGVYLPLAGGTMTGAINMLQSETELALATPVAGAGIRFYAGAVILHGGSGGTKTLSVGGSGLVVNSSFNLTNGSAGAPATTFASSTTTGIFRASSSNGLGVSVAGVERFRVENGLFGWLNNATTNAIDNLLTLTHDTSGTAAANFGAGLLFRLESSTTAAQDAARIAALWTDATHATRASALTFSTLTAGGSLTERVRIDGAGNVGIGTTSPGVTLEVSSALASPSGQMRLIAPNLSAGSNISFGIGKAVSSGNIGFLAWDNQITPFLSMETYGGANPLRFWGTQVFVTNANAVPSSTGALLHVDQSSITGAVPVLTVDQADVSEEFIRFIGTSTTDATQSLVDAADMTTPGALKGWLKIYVQDDQATNPITDGVYFVPFYAAPTA